jgi:hypothetical protein
MAGEFFKPAGAGIALLLGLCGLPGAASAEALSLPPATAWQIKPDEGSCRLLRSFGSGETLTHLSMEFYAPGDAIQLRIAGEPVDGRQKTAELGFGESSEPREYEIIRRDLPGGTPMITVLNMPTEFTRLRLAEIDKLVVRLPGSSALALKTGSLAEPLTAINDCLGEIFSKWGIDLQRHRYLTRAVVPKQPPNEWVTPEVYPVVPFLNHAGGAVNFLLVVGRDGEPLSCEIQNSSGPKQFKDAVCAALMHTAHFEPALDAGGEPLVSYFRSSVRFEIEG